MGQAGALARNLVSLVNAVADLRAAQEYTAQAAAARQAAEHMHAALTQARERLPHAGRARGQTNQPGGPARRVDTEFPVPVKEILAAAAGCRIRNVPLLGRGWTVAGEAVRNWGWRGRAGRPGRAGRAGPAVVSGVLLTALRLRLA
jgi:hypothetical protein